jgi:hypothetical protein
VLTRQVSIVGMSRSGSTLLGILLGRRDGVLYVGELVSFGAAWSHPGARCRCQEVVRDCPFWQEVVRRSGIDVVPEEITPALGRRLLEAAAGVAGAHTVVDSSKHPGWQRSLAGDDTDSIAIHIVRDPRGHLASAHLGFTRKEDGPTTPPWRLAVHVGLAWTKRNWWSLVAVRRWPRHLRIRYEALVDGGDLGVPTGWLEPESDGWDGAIHVPTGNPGTRRPGGEQIRPDTRWIELVPAGMQLVVWVLTFPLGAWYRYRPITRPIPSR